MKRSKKSFAGTFVMLGFIIGTLLWFIWHREERHWQEIVEARQQERDMANRRLADARQEAAEICQNKMKRLEAEWRASSRTKVDSTVRKKRHSLDSANQIRLELRQQIAGLLNQNQRFKDSIRILNKTIYTIKAKLKQSLKAGKTSRSRKIDTPVLSGSMLLIPLNTKILYPCRVNPGYSCSVLFVLSLLTLYVMRLRALRKWRVLWWKVPPLWNKLSA